MSKKASTIKEIAEKAGVSIGTVDRVLHNRSDVSEETRKKVLKIVQEYNYQTNVYASNLVRNKIYNFAFVIPDSVYTAYWEAPVRGFSNATSELQIFGITSTAYYFDQTNVESFNGRCEDVLAGNYDGIALAPFFQEHAVSFISECNNRGIPIVLIDSFINDAQCLAYFGQDPFQSGFLSGKLLTLAAPQKSSLIIINIQKKAEINMLFEKRIAGFKAYLKEKRPDIITSSITGSKNSKSNVQTILEKNIGTIKKSSGIFVPDSKADEVCTFLKKIDVTDKSIVAFDLTPNNIKFLEQELITFLINQKPEEQAFRAFQTLYEAVVLKQVTSPPLLFPIEILTKENYSYYVNLWKPK